MNTSCFAGSDRSQFLDFETTRAPQTSAFSRYILERLLRLAILCFAVASAEAQTETVLYSFGTNPNDGSGPVSGVIAGGDGNFYGTTRGGGVFGIGVVFKIDPTGTTPSKTETALYSFGANTKDTDTPSGLVEISPGKFAGTQSGVQGHGSSTFGTVFVVSSTGVESVVYQFGEDNQGRRPAASLVLGGNGDLYGTATAGGGIAENGALFPSNGGTVYEVNGATGTETTLYSFGANDPKFDASAPGVALLPADGVFYGTSGSGGANFQGAVYSVGASEKVLYSFGTNPDDGSVDPSSLVVGPDGDFYGTSATGGVNGMGMVFKITAAGSETVLYSFGGKPDDGSSPMGALATGGGLASDGVLFGTTYGGGANGMGTVFEITPSGTETVLCSFGATAADGTNPVGPLLIGTDGDLYGTTARGGANGKGTVFKLDPASSDADLIALGLSSGTLAPEFAAETTSYEASVSNATSSITVTPTVDQPEEGATVKVDGVTVASGKPSGTISLAVGDNVIDTVVTAPDGITKKSYTVTVTRVGSADADLHGLDLSAGTLTPEFASATTSYAAIVPNSISSVTITPTVAQADATVTVNGAEVASGTASGSIDLEVGENTITTVVTAQDDVTTKTYTVTVTRAPLSADALLSKLTLSSGTLTPAFASGMHSYTASVPNATASITVTPTTADPTAAVKIDGAAVVSGKASGSISLKVGANIVTTVVTAQDGVTKETYLVTVTRAPSSNATLSRLVLSSGTLTPAFSSARGGYAASVSNATASITVTPTVAQANATVKVNGVSVVSGKPSGAINLLVGANTITVVGTAQDGATTARYAVTVTRAPSASATLSRLVLSSGTLTPAFSFARGGYAASVSNATASITVTPTVAQANATVKVNGVSVVSGKPSGAINLLVGANTITVVGTAQDGATTARYAVTVTRAPSASATLSRLVLSSGTLTPAFSSARGGYAASVSNATASITVTPTVAQANATVKVNGVSVVSGKPSGAINLLVGANTITVVGTAQDGVTTAKYAVVVTRAGGTSEEPRRSMVSNRTISRPAPERHEAAGTSSRTGTSAEPGGVFFGVLRTDAHGPAFAGLIELAITASSPNPATPSGSACFTGMLHWGGKRYGLRGALAADGWSEEIVRPGGLPSLALTVDATRPDSSTITGRVGEGRVSTSFSARRAAFGPGAQPSPFAGQYSVTLMPSGSDSDSPQSAGGGLAQIDPSGRLRFAARLTDGTAVSQAAAISEQGIWPLYVSLYHELGFLAGEARFNDSAADLTGRADWISPWSKAFSSRAQTSLEIDGRSSQRVR